MRLIDLCVETAFAQFRQTGSKLQITVSQQDLQWKILRGKPFLRHCSAK